MAMRPRIPEQRVAILLSTFNGEAYLREQLSSLLYQSHNDWVLYWRDDGSSDATVTIMEDFTREAGQGRCVRIDSDDRHLGVTESFMNLLRAVAASLGPDDAVAFADQDDVWLPQKLARGVAALMATPRQRPTLYCARQILVNGALQPLGESARLHQSTVFPAALTQNVATGCTVMMNRRAALLVAASTPAPGTLHDWWCYLVVTAAGGRLIQDEEPVVLYRQHASNLVGAPASMRNRALGAIRRGPGVFMRVLRSHVGALRAQPELLTEKARQDVAAIHAALDGGWWRRLLALRLPGLNRQTWQETLLFRCWFLIG
jgi:glycosyltransferase involved in cell wall biosynthesis